MYRLKKWVFLIGFIPMIVSFWGMIVAAVTFQDDLLYAVSVVNEASVREYADLKKTVEWLVEKHK
ncbi:MAG: hypothetical protein JKY17_08765 [Magnetovibrio sp.]|nr:hypothetical protein [Magnetovibrio sp.]